ncbi:MAG TPA: relaxase/mobilization nuclease domain-containing protein [Epulopiscium sp.]|nr:relaxase/mobilization nuclease domain-containing protein [Candidatus Epulonipiscium sp.]
MAVTTIHPIRSTVELSIKYICNPDKTDRQILISSHGCGYKTADLDFKETWKRWNSASKIQARHLIQSFSPQDEVTAEQAHEIGKELMNKVLKGEYEYVMTTHVDKKHIHNHFVFNNVNNKTGKAYLSNKRTYHNIRDISDALCYKNRLSVIEHASGINGISYKEVLERKKGTSWKAKLQYAIDNAIKRSKDWEDFLKIMRETGYEIKEGKHISFRGKEQERFTRAKTIGEKYTEESIKNRIETRQEYGQIISKDKNRTKKIINTDGDKFQQSKGLMYWAKNENLKIASETLSHLSKYNIKDIRELDNILEIKNLDMTRNGQEVKEIEWKIKELKEKHAAVRDYKKYKNTYKKYQNAKDKNQYYQAFVSEIILFEGAKKKLGKPITKELIDSIGEIENEIKNLIKQKEVLMNERSTIKTELKDLKLIQSNINNYMKRNKDDISQGIEL